VARLAAQQHGVVGRGQLIEMGLGGNAIDRRLRQGRLHRLHPGVYAVGHSAIRQEGRWMAAVLACGKRAVLSHRAAAALWGIRQPWGGRIDVTVPRKSGSNERIQRHCSILPDDEMTSQLGIPVTSVPRTIWDLAVVVSVDSVESALRQSEYLQLHDRLSLRDLLVRYAGHPGARAVRTCLRRRAELPAGRPRSPLEERFIPFLRSHRLPRPRLNAWIQAGEGWVEVDCLWVEQRLVVELDGFAGHGTRTAFRDDRARDRRLRAAGYEVVRIAWGHLDDEPETLAADLRELLGLRRASVSL
jgi:very-short-patch-repair endonuclease/predicted transcriptional regulator of viral defense system